MTIECAIIHVIPGRVRMRVSDKQVLRRVSAELQRFLVDCPGTTTVRLNAECASVVVHYEPSSQTAQRLRRKLNDFLNGRSTASAVNRPGTEPSTRMAAPTNGCPAPALWERFGARIRTIRQRLFAIDEAASVATRDWVLERSVCRSDALMPSDDSQPDWHRLEAAQVIEMLGTRSESGLTQQEVRTRLLSCGPNSLGTVPPRSKWSTLAHQCQSLPVVLLLGSAVVSAGTGGLADAIVILGVVAINSCIGYVTERQAEQTIASLGEPAESPATVVRDGQPQTVAPEHLVPGDLVILTPGATVSADARLTLSEHLTLDESALTGESLPVPKSPIRLGGEHVPLRDRRNMVYRGTVVTGGSGWAIVVETGLDTEMGRIQNLVTTAKPPETPVQRQLRELGTTLGVLTGLICGTVFAVGLLRRYGWVDMLKTATSLAVAAVPEGLPMVATTTLALGVNRMRRLNVAVRRLEAVETLGSVQVFCLDKTGTLTQNRMRVISLYASQRWFAMDGEQLLHDGQPMDAIQHKGLRRLIEIGALCNETEIDSGGETCELNGSPTETALVLMALQVGIDVVELRRQHPALRTEYRTERRGYMATLHTSPSGRRVLAVKGRPGDTLELCRWQLIDGSLKELHTADRAAIKAANEAMADRALRVLGFAFQEGDGLNGSADGPLIWLGLIGIADPIRPRMRELMRTFHEAGIRTLMITGDQSATAQAIGRELELSGGPHLETIDSAKLECVDSDVLRSLAENTHVFSSVSPSHKLQIVQALQRAGRIVAMTGDGINDGPALKAADIGVAMGGAGTQVARMTADVVLEDDNLQTMITAIRQGRAIYDNTRHAIRYLLSTNLSEIFVMFTAVASGAGTPLNPMQLLWLNLVSDIFPVLALAVQPPDRDILRRPPRNPHEPLLSADDLKQMLVQSSVISAGSLGSYVYGRLRYGRGRQAETMAFHSLTMAQLLHMLSSRSDRLGLFSWEKPPCDRFVKLSLLGGVFMQLTVGFVSPLRKLLRNTPLTPVDIVISLTGATVPYVMNEAIKSRKPRNSSEPTPTATRHPSRRGPSR